MFKSLLSCAALLTVAFASPVYAIEVGKSSPAFDVKDIAGHEQSIAKYKGKIVVLEWNNPDCPFVKKHYGSGNMQALQKYARGQGVVWLTINSSAPGKQGSMDNALAKAKIAQLGAHQTAYILDPEGKLGTLYGAKTTPHMFVIDSKGILAYAGAIDDKATTDQEDIKTAHNYVKAAIDALIAGKPVTPAQTRSYGCSVKYEE